MGQDNAHGGAAARTGTHGRMGGRVGHALGRGSGGDGHARADGWMSGARTGGRVDERGTHLGGGAEVGMGTHGRTGG